MVDEQDLISWKNMLKCLNSLDLRERRLLSTGSDPELRGYRRDTESQTYLYKQNRVTGKDKCVLQVL